MIFGIGTDILDRKRLDRGLDAAFIRRAYTDAERLQAAQRCDPAAYYATRFAAKEAVLKALGTGLRGGELTEIVVTNDELGKPAVELRGYHRELAERLGAARINISLSHGRDTAVAYVVMEDGK